MGKARPLLLALALALLSSPAHAWPCGHGQLYRVHLGVCVPEHSALAWAYERRPVARRPLAPAPPPGPPRAAPAPPASPFPLAAPLVLPNLDDEWTPAPAPAVDDEQGAALARLALKAAVALAQSAQARPAARDEDR